MRAPSMISYLNSVTRMSQLTDKPVLKSERVYYSIMSFTFRKGSVKVKVAFRLKLSHFNC